MMNKIFLLFILFILQTNIFAADSTLTHLYFKQNKNQISLTMIATAPIQPIIFSLKNPDRLVIDFKNTKLLKTAWVNPPKSVRIGHPKKNILRIVYDLPNPMQFKSLTAKNKKEVTLMIFPKQKSIKLLSYAGLKEKIKARMHPSAPILLSPTLSHLSHVSHSTQLSPHILIVMIDPGHGGKDPGAIGPSGVQEKKVVFAIAKELAALINQTPYMHAFLTRENDSFVTLQNRLVITRHKKADLFIAIHADSYFNTRAHGASVYALSQHGATTVAAKWLVKRENYYAELNNIDLDELNDQSPLLRSVLIDLAQTATIRDSLHLANDLLDSLESVTRLHCSCVELAPFMVLKAPDIPSILVETGFISNAKEENHLRQAVFQHKIAYALFQGIRQYYNKYVH